MASPAAADTGIDAPIPGAPIPRVIREDTSGPLYYRIPSDIVRPMMRNAIGVAMRATTDDHDGGAAFTLEILGGAAVQFGRGSSYGAWIEGGYAYSRFHDHTAELGIGPSWRGSGEDPTLTSGIALIPHVIAGSFDGKTGYGVRTSLVGRSWLPFELAHQIAFVDGHTIQQIDLLLTFPAVFGGRR
ncbi:MAG TPA: hypothetical protein VGO00_13755 [Kofleriaceae bacterium]|nr:hypothetical protein [Kofleriaceae bacterium]